MPLRVVCGSCNKTLYEGQLKNVSDVIKSYRRTESVGTGTTPLYEDVSRCPHCGKILKMEDMSKKTTVREYK